MRSFATTRSRYMWWWFSIFDWFFFFKFNGYLCIVGTHTEFQLNTMKGFFFAHLMQIEMCVHIWKLCVSSCAKCTWSVWWMDLCFFLFRVKTSVIFTQKFYGKFFGILHFLWKVWNLNYILWSLSKFYMVENVWKCVSFIFWLMVFVHFRYTLTQY